MRQKCRVFVASRPFLEKYHHEQTVIHRQKGARRFCCRSRVCGGRVARWRRRAAAAGDMVVAVASMAAAGVSMAAVAAIAAGTVDIVAATAAMGITVAATTEDTADIMADGDTGGEAVGGWGCCGVGLGWYLSALPLGYADLLVGRHSLLLRQ